MHCDGLLLLVGLLMYSGRVHVQQNSPHVKCTFSNRTRIQICKGDKFIMPVRDDRLLGNFDLQQIHQHAVGIQIASSTVNGKGEIHLAASGKVEQIPALSRLRLISLHGLRFVNNTRLPIRELFYNVKHRIQRIMIQDSEIGYLDGEFLRGFSELDTLWLDNNDISYVNTDTFRDCCGKLKTLNLNGNRLQYFHWSTFAPVSFYIEEILMRRQDPGGEKQTTGLVLFPNEVSFTLSSIEIIDLAYNELDHVPAEILSTINMPTVRLFNLTHNRLCVDELTCTCCKIKPLSDWMRLVANFQGSHGVLLAFYCGFNNDPWSFDSFKPPVTHPFPEIVDKCETQSKPATPIDTSRHIISAGKATSDFEACAHLTPLQASCNGRRMRLVYDMHDFETIRAVFEADQTIDCRSAMEDVHSEALTMAVIDPNDNHNRSVDTVVIACRKGRVSVTHHNAQNAQAKRIVFNSEPNLVCTQYLMKFLEKIYDLHRGEDQGDVKLPVLVSEDLNEDELCSASPPLRFTCNDGRLALPTDRQFNISNAVKMQYDGDESFKCREHLRNMHQWLMGKHNPLLSNGTSTVPVQSHTVEVACSRGRYDISSLDPNTSRAKRLIYYSRTSPKCRVAFVEFLTYATGLR